MLRIAKGTGLSQEPHARQWAAALLAFKRDELLRSTLRVAQPGSMAVTFLFRTAAWQVAVAVTSIVTPVFRTLCQRQQFSCAHGPLQPTPRVAACVSVGYALRTPRSLSAAASRCIVAAGRVVYLVLIVSWIAHVHSDSNRVVVVVVIAGARPADRGLDRAIA